MSPLEIGAAVVMSGTVAGVAAKAYRVLQRVDRRLELMGRVDVELDARGVNVAGWFHQQDRDRRRITALEAAAHTHPAA